MMGYGTLSGNSTASNLIPSMPHVVHIRVLTEDSPLVTQRRFRRRSREDSICNWKIFALLFILISGVFIGVHLLFLEYSELTPNQAFHMIDREIWQFQSPDVFNHSLLNNSLVSFIVILHTQTESCFSFISCVKVISGMENDSSVDLKYNFLIGGDGMVYEVTGWNLQSGFNIPIVHKSLTVGLIGNFTSNPPDDVQIAEVNALISESIRREKLQANYKILGHRQKSGTSLDGEKMFVTLKNFFLRWNGFIV